MKERQNETEKIVMLSQSELIDFEENPFKVIFDEKMNELIGSIKENGVLTPIIVRPIDDRYEILSGQRRVAACRLLNIDLIPAIVKDIGYTDAVILLVDSNLQREELLFSEKAFAYKLKLDAMKSQGKRNDLTSAQFGPKLKQSREVLSGHAQKGLPAFGIYGHDVQDATDTSIPADVEEKLLRFGRAAVAAASMRGKSYLQIGSICMGIAGSIIDTAFIEDYFGMRVESVDEVEVIRRMSEGIYDEAEYKKALKWAKEKCKMGFDKNPEDMQLSPEKKEEQFEFVVKMACIIKDLMNGNPNLPAGCEEEMVGHNAIAAGFQGQRQWTDFYPNCDFPEAMLNTTFDWNGAREPMILATENDVLNAFGMLFGKLLTNRAQMFADVRTYWSGDAVKKATGYDIEGKAKDADGFIHLINSGACCLDANGAAKDENGNGVMKPWYEVTQADQDAIMENTTWNMADLGYFRGGGFSSRFLTKAEMPATMIRLNLVKGLGPVLQIAEGWTINLPDEVSDKLWARTDYTWPCTWFAPRCTGKGAFKTAYDVMNNWGANHGAISYGHIGADLITLCSILRIPVCMHNVPEDKIFRPASWNAFGMDKEGQDYRACQAYGPLYKNIR